MAFCSKHKKSKKNQKTVEPNDAKMTFEESVFVFLKTISTDKAQ
jgi:hypothetical protein